MKILQRPSPNQSIGRQNWIPDIIVCHITEGAFPGSINWVTNLQSQVSYHFLVSRTGEITQCVDIANMAWANGTTTNGDNRDHKHSRLEQVRNRQANSNLYTVSIGFEGRHSEKQGDLSAAQLVATVELIRYIRLEIQRVFNVEIPLDHESIVGHTDITPRHKPNCPGARFPFGEILKRLSEGDEMRFESILDMPQDLQPEMRRLINEKYIRGTGKTLSNGELELNILESVALSAIVASRIIDGRIEAAIKSTVVVNT